jgi:hypothetical protein
MKWRIAPGAMRELMFINNRINRTFLQMKKTPTAGQHPADITR